MKNQKEKSQEDYIPDHGPATVCLVFPYGAQPGSDGAKKMVRLLQPSIIKAAHYHSKDGKTNVDLNEEHPQPGISGLLVVKSRTENYSVHEIILSSMGLLQIHKVDLSNPSKPGFGDLIKSRIVRAPCLVSVPTARVTCPRCGTFAVKTRELLEANTEPKTIESEVNGKTVRKEIRVAVADHQTQVKSVKDLQGLQVMCPKCWDTLKPKIGQQRWKITDREVVKNEAWERAIKSAISCEERSVKKTSMLYALPLLLDCSNEVKSELIKPDPDPHDEFTAAINAFLLKNPGMKVTTYNEAVKTGRIGATVVACPEMYTFTLADAQDLRNLAFGDPTNGYFFWGRFGFVPKDIEKTPSRPGGRTLGEVFDQAVESRKVADELVM